MSTPCSVDLPATLRGISTWLHGLGTSVVSRFIFLHYAEVSRFNFEFSTSTVPCNESRWTVWMSDEWLRNVGMSQVSRFVPLHYFVIHTLNLEHYRYDLYSIALTAGSNDSILTLLSVSVWLCSAHVFEVSHFDFLRLADVYSFKFDASGSPSMFNVSVRVVCGSDGWPRRHR